MKWIKLSDDDFELFNKEIDCEYDEYMQSNLLQWQEMYNEQGQAFWLHFLITYRSFVWKCGFANKLSDDVSFPFCSDKLKRLIDEACVTVHKKFVEGQFADAKKLYDDIVVIIKYRNLIFHLSSGLPNQDPIYYNETKIAYKHLFGDLGEEGAMWNVAIFIPFYVKFAGSIYNIFKLWLRKQSLENVQNRELYWSPPSEWNEQDFKPGIFERHIFLYWNRDLIDILKIDRIDEKFSREIYKNSCYLEDTKKFCMCKSEIDSGEDSYNTEHISIKNIPAKLINKITLSKSCKCFKKNASSNYVTEFCANNTFVEVEKMEIIKERLRKKLDRKLKINENDKKNDDNCKLKFLKKAEKHIEKEINKSKNNEFKTQNEKKELNDINFPISNTAYLNLEKQSVKIKKHIPLQNNTIDTNSENLVKAEKDETNEIFDSVLDRINENSVGMKGEIFNEISWLKEKNIVYENLPNYSKRLQILSQHDCDYNSIFEQNLALKDNKPEFDLHNLNERINCNKKIISSKNEEIDEFSKELEDISDNLDTIEKSIKDKGGLDLEEFKLFLQTGRLLMKSNSIKNKIQSNKNLQEVKILSSKLHVCAQCMTKESMPKIFKKCSRCKLEKFNVPRYYCSKKCQVEDWEESHRDEHLRANKS